VVGFPHLGYKTLISFIAAKKNVNKTLQIPCDLPTYAECVRRWELTKAGYYINKREFIQAFMAGVVQLMVFLFQTMCRIRSFTVMFQRNMLPPSLG
jgi:hypothetical protein